jgi:hypothetical protein
VRFEVLTAMWLMIQIFWDVMLCRLVVTDVSEGCNTFNLSNYLTMKMKALQTYKTPSIWTDLPEDLNLKIHDFCTRQINTTDPARTNYCGGHF